MNRSPAVVSNIFETNLTKVSFEFKEHQTIVIVEYNIKYHGEEAVSCFERSRAFPFERDVVSIISNEIMALDFLTWVGVKHARK